MEKDEVEGIVFGFFSWIRKNLRKKQELKIKGLGRFYFHKKTIEAEERRRQRIYEYNTRTKQMLCNRRRRARIRQEKAGL